MAKDPIPLGRRPDAQDDRWTEPPIEGDLIDFFETGAEGVIWMLRDDCRNGHDALELLCQGDHLTITTRVGAVVWSGVIECDKRTGWTRYPRNPKLGQQTALGLWIHWVQKGFAPDDWAKLFVRPSNDRLRGRLLRKRGERDARLGPE